MSNEEYWKQRRLADMLAHEQITLEYEKLLESVYELALLEIRKEIEAFFGKYAKDNKITYAEARKRLSSSELKSFQALLKRWYAEATESNYSADYVIHLQELGRRVYLSRLENLEESIRFQLERLKSHQYKMTTELLSTHYITSYYDTAFELSKSLGVVVNFATVDTAGVEAAIRTNWSPNNYSKNIWADRDRLVNTLSKVIPQCFARGLSVEKTAQEIVKELNVSKNRARVLARTETNYVANKATLDIYKASGVEQYRYLATLDMRTSEVCRSLDGAVIKVAHAQVGVNYPPMHPNCRSTTTPYVAEENRIAVVRAARDENGKTIYVPVNMTQEEWIKKYVPLEHQERLLRFTKRYKNGQKIK